MAQHPGNRHLSQRLSTRFGDLVQLLDLLYTLVRDSVRPQGSIRLRGAGAFRYPTQVFVGEHPLRQRREGDAADALFFEHLHQAVLNPTIEDAINRMWVDS